MKYTLFLTQRCNLACDYCYVGKSSQRMSASVAARIVDFAYSNTPQTEEIDFGFFGGEPLLEFPLLQQVTHFIQEHPSFDTSRVKLAVVTNGTMLTPAMVEFLQRHSIALNISCDGPPDVHDTFRRFPDGSGSSKLVEKAIRLGLEAFGCVPVNAVYRPATVRRLPQVVDYLSALGVRQIYLNPDFSATWTRDDAEELPAIYQAVAERYMQFYRRRQPHFISLVDGKIAVILRGGYQPLEKCRMGEGEFAFTPPGDVFPCERLACGRPETHVIGNANGLISIGPLRPNLAPGPPVNAPCVSCGFRDFCMNWCGCSNFFMSGAYNRVGPFLCASEQASISIAFAVFQELEAELGPTFTDHVGGRVLAPSAKHTAGNGHSAHCPDSSRSVHAGES